MNFLALTLLLSCLPSALIDFALPKWKADRNVRIEDAYKWTFQATRGGEHAVPDTGSARKWMMGEWESLTEKTEPIWEPLCKGDEIGRLNLRPFKARGGNADWLKLDAEMKAKNYLAIHHSKAYDEAVQPAYRILTRMEMKKLLKLIK